jgi:type IV pilus assembly protein PilP
MLNNTARYFIVLIATCLLLSGCGERKHLRELQQYVTQLKQSSQQPKKIPPLKGLAPPTPVTYTAMNARSPFEAASNMNNLNGSRHPLQSYPIAQMHYKGIVTQGDNSWAFILAPDNKLYQAKIGDMIGDHYGKIVNISPTNLVIQEQVDQVMPSGKPNTRIVTMQLKGSS